MPRMVKPPLSLRLCLPIVLAAAAFVLQWQTAAVERDAARAAEIAPAPRFDPRRAHLAPPGETPIVVSSSDVPVAIEVRRGQTLGGLLAELELAPREASAAVAALSGSFDVRKLRAGTTLLAYRGPDGRLVRLRLDRDGGWVELARGDGGWQSRWHPYEQRVDVRAVAGTVEGNLEQAMRRAGGEPLVAYRMADVLAWDLDFTRDLRRGDRFAVLYEEIFLDGMDAGPGQVLALTYDNRGRRYEAYRFDGSYYDGDGRPLKKMFLRSPLRFSRVTSRFSHRRFHPILKIHRPHYGVDYGAPAGTPVRVTANGTVISAGRSGQAGNMVKVRHPNGYVTAYLHLSRFARGIRRGARVEQGQVIGYVGATGLATAPHLDYRVQKNGRWIDPLSIRPTPAEPIPAHRREAFFAYRDALRASLESGAPLTLPETRTAEQPGVAIAASAR